MFKPKDERYFNWIDANGKKADYPVSEMSDKGKSIFEDLARCELERIRLRNLLKDQDLLFDIYARELKQDLGIEDVKKENATGDT